MSLDDNVVELGAHSPSPQSVVSRLYRHMDKIKNIVVYIEYESGEQGVAMNTMKDEVLAYAGCLIRRHIDDLLFGANDEDPGS